MMPWGLKRFHESGETPFVTFCCYSRRPSLTTARSKQTFELGLERVRRKFEMQVRSYFNPRLSPATSKALIQSNNELMRTGGIQSAKEKVIFGVVNAFQWYANSWK